MMDIFNYFLAFFILFMTAIEVCQSMTSGPSNPTITSAVTTAKLSTSEDSGNDLVGIYVSFPIVIVLAVAGGALTAVFIVRRRQIADIQHNGKTKRTGKVFWRVYDGAENKPKDFMRLKAGARARLVEVAKPSTNDYYSEISPYSTQSMILPEDWYSSVYIDIPATGNSNSDNNSYDTVRQSVNSNTGNITSENRPAYDHVMIANDAFTTPKRKDGYSHLNLPKFETNKENRFKVVEDKHSNKDAPRKAAPDLCDSKEHEYYVLDPDGNLYIVHECNATM